MKILIVYHGASLEPSKAIFSSLAKQSGIELRVLGPMKGWNPLRKIWQEIPHAITQDGYTIAPGKVYKAKKDLSGPYITGLLREIRKFRPDIIHIFNEAYSLINLQAIMYKRIFLPSAKLCCLGVDNIIPKEPVTIINKVLRKIVRNGCDAVSCWSEGAVEALRQTGFPDKKLRVDYWGIPLESFSNNRNYDLRKKLAIDEYFVIGFVGRFVPEKGLYTIIESLGYLSPNIILLCVGDGPERGHFLEEVKKKDYKKRVVWIKRVSDSEIPAYMNALDCLVLPSLTTPTWKEQFGRVIPEAMSCGLPVIGSDSGAIPEIIGNAGLVFPENNGKALSECINKIAVDKQLNNKLSIMGQQRAKTLFSVNAYSEKLHRLYLEMLQS